MLVLPRHRSALESNVWLGFLSVKNNCSSLQVYWNVPSKVCHSRKVSIPLEQFGITHNKGHEFLGDQIVIFYEYDFGYFPYYLDYNAETPINGGLPQNCPIDKHLIRVSQQIREAIPREDFSGIAVIDFEEWRPLYQLNWGKKAVYRRESIRLVRKQYPQISEKSAEEMAKKEFNSAAKKVFLHTIALARQMRPYARWGFYGFPYCNYDAGNSETDMLCSEKFRKYNDEYVLLLTFFVFSKEFHIYIYRMFCSDKLRQLNNEIGCNTALLT
ncbi:unnamed protein product [Heligmosomoides polygyrus]|uniref:Hyaluronidase n=1 Tax=Heligmosomoides polygyrus TaxID=6339 RepID=A0A3P8BXN2_HELPZ|nr:unnamed protein product [Heligmosomoides polygyrus]